MKHVRTSLTKRVFMHITAVALIAAGVIWPASAQKSAKRHKQPILYSVKANHVMRVRLNQAIGSETSRIGDKFTATLVDPIYSSNGLQLAPQGSIIAGKVTQIQRAQKNGKPGTMDVQFVSIRLPNGKHFPINGSLTDLSTKSGKSDNEGTVSANETSHRKVKFIGGGAGGGALIGAIAGGGKGLAIGAGVGALAGGLAGHLKKGSEVKVDPGTEFGVILNQPLRLPKYSAS
jgi:hypothetical protein